MAYHRPKLTTAVIATRTQAEAQGISPGEIDLYVGKITGCSFEAEVSTQGKLLIPKKQRERMNLVENATIVGRGAYFEIWKPEDFEATNTPEVLGRLKLDQMFHILS